MLLYFLTLRRFRLFKSVLVKKKQDPNMLHVCSRYHECRCLFDTRSHGPLTRYVKLRVAHAPGMPGTISPPLTSKETASYPGMHHGTCFTHVPWCMSGSLARGGGGKSSRHSWRMHNTQFYVSGKRPIVSVVMVLTRNVIVLAPEG